MVWIQRSNCNMCKGRWGLFARVVCRAGEEESHGLDFVYPICEGSKSSERTQTANRARVVRDLQVPSLIVRHMT